MSDILRLSVPLAVWIAAFSAIYGLKGVVCSDRWPAAGLSLDQVRAALIAAGLAALGLQVALLAALGKRRFASSPPWVQRLATLLGGVALVATAWSLMPCSPLRSAFGTRAGRLLPRDRLA